MVFEHDFVRYPELSNRQLENLQFLSPHPQIVEDFEGFVEKVTDGDTVTLTTSFRDFSFPVRLLDIDAPEMNEGGEEAKEYLRSRVEGKKVTVLIDRRQRVGKYGRLLGKVVSGGVDVGEEMLAIGLVSEFGQKDSFKPMPLDKVFSMRWLYASF